MRRCKPCIAIRYELRFQGAHSKPTPCRAFCLYPFKNPKSSLHQHLPRQYSGKSKRIRTTALRMTSERYRLKMLSPDQTDILRENYPSVVTPTATSRFYAHQAYIFYHTLRHIARVFYWSIYRTFITFYFLYKAFCTKIIIFSLKKPCKTIFSRFLFPLFSIIYSFVINFLDFLLLSREFARSAVGDDIGDAIGDAKATLIFRLRLILRITLRVRLRLRLRLITSISIKIIFSFIFSIIIGFFGFSK